MLGGDGFEPAYQALNGAITSGHNKGFLRSDAALVVIVVNNSDDTSANLTGNPLNFYYTFFQNLKGYNPLTPFIFNAVSITPAEFASGAYNCPNNSNIYFDTCPSCGGAWNDTQSPPWCSRPAGS